MYHVKVKRYLDSLQIQYFEAEAECDKKNDYEPFTLFEDIKREKMKLFDEWHDYDLRVPFEPLDDLEEERQKSAESLRISMSRTIRKIYDYGKSNRWEWWLTFTFNKEKVDRYDYQKCSKKMSTWLMNVKKKCPDIKYMIVPERHKDGAWHFHALISNAGGLSMVDSGRKYKGQVIYNVEDYKLGFTYAIRTDGSMKVVGYLTKYITKDLCEFSKGKKRYWVSRNLDLPDILEYYTYESFEEVISAYDISEAYFKSGGSFMNVNICEIPIYSTSTSRFVESETNENNIDFDSGIDLEN